MYKDKDKQREADRERQKRRRDRIKAKGVTDSGCDRQGVTDEMGVTVTNAEAEQIEKVINTEIRARLKGGFTPVKTAQGNIRVSKPGDADSVQDVTAKLVQDKQGLINRSAAQVRDYQKRGKDIKCFEDLPPDVQATIRNLSDTNEEFQRRVGIAIRYQHQFPDRYYTTGVA